MPTTMDFYLRNYENLISQELCIKNTMESIFRKNPLRKHLHYYTNQLFVCSELPDLSIYFLSFYK